MDTITAISTPPGKGGIAVIRISGDRSLEIADKVFKGRMSPSKLGSHRVIHGEIYDGDNLIDEVLLTVMRSPHTYTGEDVVEISCHGGRVTANRILRAILNSSARLAGPGEFTLRAFLNGKIDLIQAEAIGDIVNASSLKAQQYALSSLKGELSKRINEIKESLKRVETLIEASINFPGDVAIDETDIYVSIRDIKVQVETLLEGAQCGRFIRNGINIPIVGRTNVGKSSLFNRILGKERVIVTSIPGTTRDIVEGTVEMEGICVTFLDTCGVRSSRDEIEVEGINRAKRVINDGDVVLLVIDQSQPLNDEDHAFIDLLKYKDVIAVLNKCDIKRNGKYELPFRKISVSAKTGENIQKLLGFVRNEFSSSSKDIFMLKERHINILNKVKESIENALHSNTFELTAYDVKSAIDSLKEMTGEIKSREVLESIFSQFCIGK
jgi:tRNA modification GTPase